jgi:hypothetical protein
MDAKHRFFAAAVDLRQAIDALTKAEAALEGTLGDSANTFMTLGMKRLADAQENLFHAERKHLQRDKHAT